MKVYDLDVHLSWLIVIIASIFSIIFSVFICLCWKGRRSKTQTYVIHSDKTRNSSIVPTNSVSQIIAGKQKYFLHDVQYSSINNSGELSTSCDLKTNDHFSYNILSIFKNIQNNKFANVPDDMAKILPDALEDSATEAMHKNFDKTVLSLQWNETPENRANERDRDETYSCISNDSKNTYKSVVPFYNRSYSIAETFKSTNSDN